MFIMKHSTAAVLLILSTACLMTGNFFTSFFSLKILFFVWSFFLLWSLCECDVFVCSLFANFAYASYSLKKINVIRCLIFHFSPFHFYLQIDSNNDKLEKRVSHFKRHICGSAVVDVAAGLRCKLISTFFSVQKSFISDVNFVVCQLL